MIQMIMAQKCGFEVLARQYRKVIFLSVSPRFLFQMYVPNETFMSLHSVMKIQYLKLLALSCVKFHR